MKKYIIIVILLLGIAIHSCKKDPYPSSTGTFYLDLPSTAYQYYPSSGDSINKIATLGRVLFYDTRLSINNAVSCGSCHKQQFAFADNAALSKGFEDRLTKRNSPPIQNLFGSTFHGVPNIKQAQINLFWDGRENNIQNLIVRPISNHVEMGIDDLTKLPAKLAAVSYYAQLFTDAYGSSEITNDKISNAVAMFISSIQSTHSRFDQSNISQDSSVLLVGSQSNIGILSPEEQHGYVLFMTKYNCASCHHIITNTYTQSESFIDAGLDATYSDLGRGVISNSSADNGKFKIPSLHNVALTAPYMHDGRFKTLEEVIDHYSTGIEYSANLNVMFVDSTYNQARQMNISAADKQALVAFLKTFTDYQMITDPKFSNPFKTK
jgi:cytochrome c peroxidase